MQYINISDYIFSKNYIFNFFIGGRGVGKTFSAIRHVDKNNQFFLFLRTTQKEIDIACDSNEFGKVNRRFKCNRINEDMWGIYKNDKLVGYGAALSTFKNVRGVNFSDVETIIFDEFIPEISARNTIKDPATALFNLIESVNRNREIEGQPPALFLGLANANEIYNPYFVELNIISHIEEVLNEGRTIFTDPDRLLRVVILQASDEFISAKQQTALYKLTRGTKFEQMALNNQFSFNDFSFVRKMKTNGFKPIVQFDNCVLWKKKNQNFYLIKKSFGKVTKNYYDISNEIDKELFVKKYKNLIFENLMNQAIYFNSYEAKRKTLDILKIKS